MMMRQNTNTRNRILEHKVPVLHQQVVVVFHLNPSVSHIMMTWKTMKMISRRMQDTAIVNHLVAKNAILQGKAMKHIPLDDLLDRSVVTTSDMIQTKQIIVHSMSANKRQQLLKPRRLQRKRFLV